MKIFITKFFILLFTISVYGIDDEINISSSNASFKCRNDITTLSVDSTYVAYLWNTGEITPTITVNTPGYYSVTVTDENACSFTSKKFRLSGTGNGALLAIIRTLGSTDLCLGESVTLFGNEGFRYEWSNGDTINNLIVNEISNYSLTLIDSLGCRSLPSDTLYITVFNPTRPEITVTGPIDFCNENDGTVLTATYNTTFNFRWNTGETDPTLKIINPGSYFGIIANNDGCEIISSPVFITPQNTTVPAILSSSDFILCPNEVLTLTAYFDSTIYDWSNGETTKSVDFTEGGNYTLNLVDENGCRSVTAPIEIEKPDIYKPDIFSNGPTTFCSGSSVILKADADPNHFWQWQDGSQSLDTVVSVSSMFYITALDFESGCRINSDTVNVVVGTIEKPIIKYDTDTTLCRGDSIILYSNPSFGYFWNGPGATDANQRDPFLIVKKAGIYELAHINEIGCVSGSEPITIIVDTLSNKLNITGDFNFELNVFEDYSTNASENTNLLWESTGGIINLPNEDTITVFWDNIDNADLCVTHTSEFGCEQEKICVSDIIIDVKDVYLDAVQLTPNPCNSIFVIKGIEPALIDAVKVYNSNGALINIKQNDNSLIYEFTNNTSGIYMVEIITKKRTYLKKLHKL